MESQTVQFPMRQTSDRVGSGMFGRGMETDDFEFSIPLPIIPLPYCPEIFVYDNDVA
jgi:hypothetical protein